MGNVKRSMLLALVILSVMLACMPGATEAQTVQPVAEIVALYASGEHFAVLSESYGVLRVAEDGVSLVDIPVTGAYQYAISSRHLHVVMVSGGELFTYHVTLKYAYTGGVAYMPVMCK